MHREGHFVQEKIQPRSEVGVRGHGGRPSMHKTPPGLYKCKKSLFSQSSEQDSQRSTVSSVDTSHEQNLQGMSLPTSVHHK